MPRVPRRLPQLPGGSEPLPPAPPPLERPPGAPGHPAYASGADKKREALLRIGTLHKLPEDLRLLITEYDVSAVQSAAAHLNINGIDNLVRHLDDLEPEDRAALIEELRELSKQIISEKHWNLMNSVNASVDDPASILPPGKPIY